MSGPDDRIRATVEHTGGNCYALAVTLPDGRKILIVDADTGALPSATTTALLIGPENGEGTCVEIGALEVR